MMRHVLVPLGIVVLAAAGVGAALLLLSTPGLAPPATAFLRALHGEHPEQAMELMGPTEMVQWDRLLLYRERTQRELGAFRRLETLAQSTHTSLPGRQVGELKGRAQYARGSVAVSVRFARLGGRWLVEALEMDLPPPPIGPEARERQIRRLAESVATLIARNQARGLEPILTRRARESGLLRTVTASAERILSDRREALAPEVVELSQASEESAEVTLHVPFRKGGAMSVHVGFVYEALRWRVAEVAVAPQGARDPPRAPKPGEVPR